MGVTVDQAGQQRLDGEQTLDVLRYRAGYDSGDFGRMETQQALLEAVVSQFLSLGSIPHISDAAEILSGSMTTDLSAEDAISLAGKLLLCEDVNFDTMPVLTSEGEAAVMVDVPAWLELVNARLTPADSPITEADMYSLTTVDARDSW